MIINLTDQEAFAIMQKLNSNLGTGAGLNLGEAIDESTQVNLESLESGKVKLEAAMKRSDNKLSRALDGAISSLTASGFDSSQIEALQSARTKATEHNSEKYPKKK